MTPYDRVVAALKAQGSIRRGGNWSCPSHEDRTPSLSVNPGVRLEGDIGEPTVLVHCHAGCAVDDVLSALGLEPSDLFTGNGQGELFPASKFSPVGLDILRKLPPGSERSFLVASALGRYVDRHGGRSRVGSQREIAAVIVEAKHRRAIERELGIRADLLRHHISQWKAWGVAHACSTTVLTIFVREGMACPVCKACLDPHGFNPKSVSGSSRSACLDPHAHDPKVCLDPHGSVPEMRQPATGSLKSSGGEELSWSALYPEGDGGPTRAPSRKGKR
jgi:hypothetical protein